MPNVRFTELSSDMDKDIAAVAGRARKVMELAIDRAVANTIDKKRFPVSRGSLEDLLARRLSWMPNPNPKKRESRADIEKARKGRIDKAQSRWRERYTDAGKWKKASSDFRPLGKAAHLDSGKPILEEEDPRKYLFSKMGPLVKRMCKLAVRRDEKDLASKKAYRWASGLFGPETTQQPAAPAKTDLECLIKEVKCVIETPGFFGSHAGDDEIAIGGVTISPTGAVKKIRKTMIGDFARAGVTRAYNPPDYMKFTSFPLTEPGDWPRAFVVIFALAEVDMGGFGDFLSDLLGVVQGWVVAALVSAGAEAILIALGGGAVVGGLIGAIVAAIAAIIVVCLISLIVDIIEDDMFEPVVATIKLEDQAAANSLDLVSQDVWPVVNCLMKELSLPPGTKKIVGHYQVFYSWRSR